GRPVTEPYRHESKVVSAHFSPNGQHVLTATVSGKAHIWDVPPTISVLMSRPSPGQGAHHSESGKRKAEIAQSTAAVQDAAATLSSSVLADLAEAVVGKRINAEGALENVSSTVFSQTRERVANLPREADFTRWLEWFLADRSTRSISPYSRVGLPQYITSLA